VKKITIAPPTKPPERAIQVFTKKEQPSNNAKEELSIAPTTDVKVVAKPPDGEVPGKSKTIRKLPGPPPKKKKTAIIPGPPTAKKKPKQIPPPPSEPASAPKISGAKSQSIMPGRIFVKIFQGNNIQKHDAKSALRADLINPFVELQIGSEKQRSKVLKKQNKYPDWEGQALFFDLLDPISMLNSEDDLPLMIKVYAKGGFSNTLLGETEISILPYFEEHKGEQDEYELSWTHKKTGNTIDAGAIELQLTFQPAHTGILVATLHHGRNLKNMDSWGKQDPYCKFEIHKTKRKSKVVQNGGTNPYFGEQELEFWIDGTNWMHALSMSVWDEDVGSDDFIGARGFSVLPFMEQKPGESVRKWIKILDKKSKDAGEIEIGFAFYPAGQMKVNLRKGRNLLDADSAGKQDPYVHLFTHLTHLTLFTHTHTHTHRYVKLTLLSEKWGNVTLKTKTDTNGGTEPIWNETFTFPIVDQYEMRLECYDEDMISSDDLIGKQKISLLPYFRIGQREEWVPIINRDQGWGQNENAGEIFIEWTFVGPSGVAYPQRQPLVDSFDEKERVNFKADKLAELEDEYRQNIDQEEKMTEQQQLQLQKQRRAEDEFTESEILDAFRFFDLDKNMYIGAAELRHCLICMGELVTDEEISEMIRMVDLDGVCIFLSHNSHFIINLNSLTHTRIYSLTNTHTHTHTHTGRTSQLRGISSYMYTSRSKQTRFLSWYVTKYYDHEHRHEKVCTSTTSSRTLRG